LGGSDLVAEAARLGFRGFVAKDIPVREFVSVVESVIGGETVLPRYYGRETRLDRSSRRIHDTSAAGDLTQRERTVLQLLVEGASSARIANQLTISPNTVRTYVQNILVKLQVHSRVEAAAYAIRHGLVRREGWPRKT
jgi:DNA-binding NarL/FixJ family response regulator